MKGKTNKTVTITMPLHIAETLHGFIDGGMGTSEDVDFNKQMRPIRKKLETQINKHYPNRKK